MEGSSQAVARLPQPHISLYSFSEQLSLNPTLVGFHLSASSDAINRWLNVLCQRTELKFQRRWPHISRYPMYVVPHEQTHGLRDTPTLTCSLAWKKLIHGL